MYQNLNKMFYKFFRSFSKNVMPKITVNGVSGTRVRVRRYSDLVPPNQYDTPIPKRLHIGYVMKEYWETIPLFLTTAASITILAIAIIWACRNKVDIVFSTHSRDNISRTMDLRNPSIHKMLIINQRYEPWPEMQDLLDRMTVAEKRARVRAETCSHP